MRSSGVPPEQCSSGCIGMKILNLPKWIASSEQQIVEKYKNVTILALFETSLVDFARREE